MATQLILYPQNYSGVSSVLSNNPDEMLVDGINFATMNASPALDTFYTGYVPASQVIIQQPPTFPNSWYRFRSTSPQPTLPTASNGSLTMTSPSGAASTVGIYQRLTSLTVGTSYTVTVNLSTTDAGAMNIHAFSGAAYIGGASPSVSTTNSTITKTFIAPATTATIMVMFTQGTIASTIVISHISVVETGLTPSLDISNLEDGQVICDLYEDETIPLTLSVDNFKNAAEQVQSYSKAFNLPATKRNNQIFENLFEVTRSAQNHTTFNPYAKTKCALKQDGFILFEGYLRVLDIQDKEGEISYNVNLYSEVIALADVLGDKTFNDIDFSELTHAYNYTNIRNTWSGNQLVLDNALPAGSYAGTGTTTGVVRYPFVDWNHQYTVGTNDKPVLPNLESSFRPFITLKYLIQRIFAETNLFTYTSNFIDNDPDFQKLHMDFNWGGDTFPTANNEYNGSWNTSDPNANKGTGSFKPLALSTASATSLSGSTLPPNYDEDIADNFITSTTTNEMYQIFYNYTVENVSGTGAETVDFQWVHTDTDPSTSVVTTNVINPRTYSVSNTGVNWRSYVGSFTVILRSIGDTIKAQFKAPATCSQMQFASRVRFVQSSFTVNSATLNTLRGDLGQWEFIKGIMTMFNLVSMPDPVNPNNILIEPYNDIFLNNSDSKELNWTDKVDISEIKLTPLTELNKKTLFKFVEDDDDYIFNVYKNSVQGHLYGSKLFDATLTTGGLQSVLDGEEEIVAEPFAATVSKPLMSQFYDFIVPSIYSYNADDGTSQGFDNSPRIMYMVGTRTSTDPNLPFISTLYVVPAQNGSSGDDFENEFLQFCHLTDLPTVVNNPPLATDTRDFHFGECQLINPIGDATPNNLFNTYWLPYFNELYNPDTRTMTLKVNLSAGDINTFRFYDTVFIKNRTFRVNKIDYKPNDLATVEFILIP
jgi:uncharacterized protein affecting Mg2+/Co2+ transport